MTEPEIQKRMSQQMREQLGALLMEVMRLTVENEMLREQLKSSAAPDALPDVRKPANGRNDHATDTAGTSAASN